MVAQRTAATHGQRIAHVEKDKQSYKTRGSDCWRLFKHHQKAQGGVCTSNRPHLSDEYRRPQPGRGHCRLRKRPLESSSALSTVTPFSSLSAILASTIQSAPHDTGLALGSLGNQQEFKTHVHRTIFNNPSPNSTACATSYPQCSQTQEP
eukprot:comp24069_c1_seq1/m.43277 comp24069_c1_seq1/g.43277  ORF comp24069_c1_seq1/g.43277 comp24069_c1_seq1/m.43277 type:complete len:150 (+) comp24069_c1_seq1:1558-2007(+)